MNQEVKEQGGYVYIPEGSQVLIVRDENEGLATQTDEEKTDFRVYWHTFKKYKWIILGLTLLFGLLTTLWVGLLAPIYRSTAMLLIEFDQAKIISIEEIYEVSSLTDEHYETQVKILESRVLAEKLVDKLNLVSHPTFNPTEQKSGFSLNWREWLPKAWLPPEEEAPPPTLEDRRKAIVEAIMEDLSITPVQNSQLVEISFESPNAKLAAKIPNTLADIYIESDLEAKLAMTNKAASWLTKRIEELGKNLKKSEQALQHYVESQGLVNVTGVKTLATKQIEETASNLANARIQLAKVENVYRQVQALRGRSTNALESIPAIANHSLVQDAKQAELAAARKVSELSERYGQKHPRIIAAKAELKAAEANTAKQIQQAIEGITKEYELALANVKTLSRVLAENKRKIQEINRKEYQLGVLEREVTVNRQLYELFLTRFKETNASQDVQGLQSTIGRVVEPALVASVPYKPKKKRIVAIGLVLGFFFSTMLAFFLEYLNNTLKDSEDVEQKLGLPLLGTLPKLKVGKKDKLKPMWMFLKAPKSSFAESVRTIRTGIMLSDFDSPHKVLVVTSSVSGEGKTTLALNQACALGHMVKTLLIEADMRRPSLAKLLGLSSNAPGLSELVAGTQKFDECIYHIGDKGNFDIIPSGMVPPNPLELLSSSRFGEILEQLSQKYGYVVIDSAPTMVVSDALVLAKHASGVLYIVKADATPYQVVREGLKRLRQAKIPVHNIILNQVNTKKPSRYYYGKYKYGYHEGYYGEQGSLPSSA